MFVNHSLSTTMKLSFVLVLSVSVGSGCSLSNSSGSISDSLSSPSDWSGSSSDSSGSSSDDSAESHAEEPESKQDAQAYAADVAQLAYTYGMQGGDIGSLRNGISNLAVKRGLTNWEVDSLTCQSIGEGVGQAGMSESDFEDFSKRLFGDDLTKANELRVGYQASQTAGDSTDSKAQSQEG